MSDRERFPGRLPGEPLGDYFKRRMREDKERERERDRAARAALAQSFEQRVEAVYRMLMAVSAEADPVKRERLEDEAAIAANNDPEAFEAAHIAAEAMLARLMQVKLAAAESKKPAPQ